MESEAGQDVYRLVTSEPTPPTLNVYGDRIGGIIGGGSAIGGVSIGYETSPSQYYGTQAAKVAASWTLPTYRYVITMADGKEETVEGSYHNFDGGLLTITRANHATGYQELALAVPAGLWLRVRGESANGL